MASTILREALADVKAYREVIEKKAQRAVIDAVTPRLREFIEREMLGDDDNEVEELGGPGEPELKGDLLTDMEVDDSAAAISPPDEEGKVTLDIDALVVGEQPVSAELGLDDVTDEHEFVVTDESVKALKPIVDASKSDLALRVESLAMIVDRVIKAGKNKALVESASYKNHLIALVVRVNDTYQHVQQESALSQGEKERLTKLLDVCSSTLQESNNMKTTKKNKITEGEVTMKLTGLPDDLDLDTVGVDLITDEGEEGTADVDVTDEEPVDGDEDMDLDMTDDEEPVAQESHRMSDDTVVEIDEALLRREISKMRKIRETTDAEQAWGFAPGTNAGEIDGDPLDLDIEKVEDETDARIVRDTDKNAGSWELTEGDDEDDETVDEGDLDELGNRRKEEEFGLEVADGHATPRVRMEVRVRFEKKLQERITNRIAQLRKDAKGAKGTKLATMRETYKRLNKKLAESQARTTKLVESTKKTVRSERSTRPTEPAANLRAKLAEANLSNAKLLVSNKLLQCGKMTESVTRRLNGAKSVDDVKKVYKLAMRPTQDLKESVVAGSSRATRSGGTVLTESAEGYVMDRWSKLAGISTK